MLLIYLFIYTTQLLMDPQSCTKCSCLPEDILMLACSHDLCLNCASDRLAFEMKKKKNANSIVCEFCYERTPLDAQSISQLQKMISPSKLPGKSVVDTTTKKSDIRTDKKFQPSTRNAPSDRFQEKYNYQKTSELGIDRGYDRVGASKVGTASRQAFQGISSKKSCNEHPQQQILYFCFDCKCQCICPQCVIHGKHKDHDVKTIRKAQPIVKGEVDAHLGKFQNNIQGLLIRKSQIEKQMRNLTEQNNVSKRQVQQAFEDLRIKIANQQKQILSRCDQILSEHLEQLDKVSKSIVKRMDELKNYTATMNEAIKKQQILFLNFYSRKHKEINEQSREIDMSIPSSSIASNQSILSSILDIGDQVTKIGNGSGSKGYRYNS